MDKQHSVLSGTNLILAVGGAALGYSSGCKVSTTVETGERLTKESPDGKWPDKYAKKFSEEITGDGFVLTDSDKDIPTYDILKDLMLKGEPVEMAYSLRDGDKRTGKTTGGYKGKYLITSLELDGQSGDEAKYSIKAESCGAVAKIGEGLTEAEVEQVNALKDEQAVE